MNVNNTHGFSERLGVGATSPRPEKNTTDTLARTGTNAGSGDGLELSTLAAKVHSQGINTDVENRTDKLAA